MIATHPAIPDEPPVTAGARALELRMYLGEALLDVRHFVDAEAIVVGETARADVWTSGEGLPVDDFPLLRRLDGDDVLTLCTGMTGEVELDGQVWSLDLLRRSPLSARDPEMPSAFRLRLGNDSRAVLHWAGLTLALRFVSPPERTPSRRFAEADVPYLNALLCSVCALVTAVVTLRVHPFDTHTLAVNSYIDAVVELYPPQLEPPRPPPKPAPSTRVDRPTQRKASPPSAAKSGPTRRATVAGANNELRQALRDFFFSQNSDLLHGAGQTPLADALRGGLKAGPRGSSLTPRVDLPPSDSPFGGLRRAGPLDTAGTRRLDRTYGRTMSLPPARQRVAVLGLPPPRIQDPADREAIHRVIEEHRNQIRYCYERELQRDHSLSGKVAVHWRIGANGEVALASISESTLQNSAAEKCILDKIRTWQFPPPLGGGTVEVNYPFVFRST